MNFKRARHQHGSLTIETRKNGPDVWVFRWRDSVVNGVRVKRKAIVGSKLDLPTRTAAIRELDGLRRRGEIESPASQAPLTVSQLVAHFKTIELSEDGGKTRLTRKVYEHHLDALVIPKWGEYRLDLVKAVAVEQWLKSLPYAPATKAKTRNVMSALFQHALRYEWALSNPIRLVRQSAKRLKEPEVLSTQEVLRLLDELPELSRTLVTVALITGLRRGELFGLKWADVDFERGELRIVRSLVDQVEGPTKTAGSRRTLPLTEWSLEVFREWKSASKYVRSDDWVFASPQSLGTKPFWPDVVLTKQVKPAAIRAGITKTIGWHTFRRTFATEVQAFSNVKVTQELLGHSSPSITLGIYARAVTQDKRDAQTRVATLYRLNVGAEDRQAA